MNTMNIMAYVTSLELDYILLHVDMYRDESEKNDYSNASTEYIVKYR